MELKLEGIKMDTSLAKSYLKNIKEFHSFGAPSLKVKVSNLCWDMIDYQIFYFGELDQESFDLKNFISTESPKYCNLESIKILKALAGQIQENTNLFVQLEYLLRNKPAEDTQKEVELLTKKMKCGLSMLRCSSVTMFADSPLLMLGLVAGLKTFGPKTIVATKETAAISYLFTKLCHKVGLDDIFLIIASHESLEEHTIKSISVPKEWNFWALAAVSEHSDVDSAVDTFLTCSVQSPWKLRRILVQESVYQQFKDSLSWKCSLKGANVGDEVFSTYQQLCPDVLKYENRIFMIDYIGLRPTPQLLSEVAIEAYRTNKELLALIGKYEPFFLSLWSNDVAEVNEITLAVQSPVVWVNSFADFRGPTRISNVIYDALNIRTYKKNESLSKLMKTSDQWLKLDIDERKAILYNLIEANKPKLTNLTGKNAEFFTNILIELEFEKTEGFVEVGKDYVCLGVARPVGIIEVNDMMRSLVDFTTLKYLILGNALVVSKPDPLLELFEKSNIPIACIEFEKGDDCRIRYESDNVTKVIWTNLGTIFAN